MNIQEAMSDPKPDRTLPRFTWEEAVAILLEKEDEILIQWRRRAYEVVMRISAKTDIHGNYKN